MTPSSPIYMDHNATTPLAEAVADRMTAVLREEFGNPSSVHHFGQRAKSVVDEARSAVAELIGGDPSEVIFTSGGTESDNFALRGAAEALEPSGRRHLVSSGIEHEAVLNTLKALARRGWQTTLMPVGATGLVTAEGLTAALTDQTAVVSIMHANNEIGTIQPVAELTRLAKARGAVVHTDAVQTAGKIPLNVKALGVDLLSISAHKFYGPKGVGALWVRRGLRLLPFMTGGKQERGRRSGTENVAAIAGMGVAARLAMAKMAEEASRLASLRDRLEQRILQAVPGTAINGDPDTRVPNTSNISFDRVEAESLLIALDLEGVAVSTGSACSSGSLEPSHVLRAMGVGDELAHSSIRFGFGRFTTKEQVDYAIDHVIAAVKRLRELSPLYEMVQEGIDLSTVNWQGGH